MKMSSLFRVVLAVLFVAASANIADAEKLRVVTSFSIPADWAQEIAGDEAEVVSILPPNADAHSFHASPRDLKKLVDADLVIAMSPKFEKWLDEISRDLRTKNPQKFVFLADELLSENPGEDSVDPHFWMNPQIVAEKFLPKIETALKIENPEYREKVATLKGEGEREFAAIPRERRKIVTYHRNLENFADCFGFEVVGTILDSASTDATDPSAKRIATLSKKIRDEKIPILVDNNVNDRVPIALAKEAGAGAPRKIRVDSLDAPGTPAGTYIGMMRENFRVVAEACETEK